MRRERERETLVDTMPYFCMHLNLAAGIISILEYVTKATFSSVMYDSVVVGHIVGHGAGH